jgi:hypothetical protein
MSSVDTAEHVPPERVVRPHDLLAHAERNLASVADEFARADAVLALKRAVNSRLKHLEELYGFALSFPKSVGALERLEAVDLARPLLVRQMFELRNDIEHNDAPVPELARCAELVDATWYFLRATDAACSEAARSLTLRPRSEESQRGSNDYISLYRFAPGLPRLTVTARVQEDLLVAHHRPGYIEVLGSPEFKQSMLEVLARSKLSAADVGDQEYGRPGERVQFGEIAPDDALRLQLWRKLFQAHRLSSSELVVQR